MHGLRYNSGGNASKRISVADFSVPKLTMRLAANQGNPKQLATLLAAKQTKKKRILRPKREYYSPVTPQEAIPGPSVDPRPESSEKKNEFCLSRPNQKINADSMFSKQHELRLYSADSVWDSMPF